MAAILLGMPPNGGTSTERWGIDFPGRVVVGDDVVCSVLVALAVLIWPGNKSGRLYRLAYRGRAVDSAAINEPRYAGSPRVGVAQVITSAIARLRGGGTLVEAFEERSSRRFATQRITVERLITVFEQRRLPDEITSAGT